MNYGKSIELFLVNGDPSGLITAELSNWNGKAIKIPRIDVPKCSREDVTRPGVYFLFCQNDDGEDSVYIGEAEKVIERLDQHIHDYQADKEKYYWNTAVIFIGTDLTKAHIRYLEDRFVKIARECHAYKVLTKNTYSNTVLKEAAIASMEEFIDNVKLIINILGYKVLESAPQVDEHTEYLYCKGSGGDAKGFVSAGGFTVVKGSKVSNSTVPSFETRGKGYFNLRNRLISDGVIVEGFFEQDYEFNAPSAASAVILGHTSNGNTDWKTANGIKLKELGI